jgi:radical SAM protein with 4Fe4S-binding SPASM domain
MEAKQIIKNKSFCPLPWTGFIVQQNGDIKHCVLAKDVIGNINERPIQEILSGEDNNKIKKQMLADNKPSSCTGCYKLEEGKNNFDIISQRIYYIKELRTVDPTLYDQIENFDLHTVDIRWTNQCNQACVYCGPHNSTLWEKEVGPSKLMSAEAKNAVRSFIFDRVAQLKNVYLAGGEPTLMNENLEFLNLLLEKNPNVQLRVNTNLSNIDTKVARLIKKFKNVHWIVSVEATGNYYNYIRYGGDWEEFCKNLNAIGDINRHKISFNMLYCILNHLEIFKCIDFLTGLGFHNNSFVLGPLYTPEYLNILNLPVDKIKQIKTELKGRIDDKPGHILEDGYINLLRYLDTPFTKDLDKSFDRLKILDQRRKLNSQSIFKELYDKNC